MRASTALVLVATLVAPLDVVRAAETIASADQRSGLALTITQGDNALVRDRRAVTLDRGSQVLVIEGVARHARDATAMLTGKGVAVVEQGFDLAGINAERLLARAVGGEVTVVWRDSTGSEREQRAKVIAAGPQPVFEIDGKVVAGTPVRVLYDALPETVRPLPAYRATITAEGGGRRDLELSYLTNGLSWQADYLAEIAPGDSQMTVNAWATLNNDSGTDYPAAQVQLLAGDLSRVSDGAAPRAVRMEKMLMATADAPSRDSIGGYHLFTLAKPVSLRDGERKQVALLPPSRMAIQRWMVLDPLPVQGWRDVYQDDQDHNPRLMLTVKNDTGSPLPAGAIRVMQRDGHGAVTPVGENTLPALPVNTSANLTLGRAFDVTARRTQTDFTRVSAEITEAAWEIKLRNAEAAPVSVVVREAFGSDWLVLEESAKHVKQDAFTASWVVTVPAQGQTVLKYRVRVKG